MNVVQTVKQTIQQHHMLDQGDCVVVAVSGGPDSVALLHLLLNISKHTHWRIVVAHVNHQFRGEEADKEAAFVKHLAQDWGLVSEIAAIDVPAYIEKTKKNTQEAARECRYQFLVETAIKHGATAIALAHHADDQAETVLMRFIRGSGTQGMSGMPFIRPHQDKVHIIRPLLNLSKQTLMAYLHDHTLSYCQDSSNLSSKYLRNKIRNELMPILETYNPQMSTTMNRLANVVAADEDYMMQEAKRTMKDMVSLQEDVIVFARNSFKAHHIALQRRMIKLILNCLDHSNVEHDFIKMEQMRNMIVQDSPSNAIYQWSKQHRLVREYDNIRMGNIHTHAVSGSTFTIEKMEHIEISWINRDIQFNILHKWDQIQLPQSKAIFDLDALKFPLILRSRQRGDRMQVFGIKGSKKVKDMLIDHKIPPTAREAVPILTDSTGLILWVVGVKRSSHAIVTKDTQQFLHINTGMDIQYT
ncbi:tRNA lysidine(34) synthetase TilS [Longirhabdus pacifica]|uniref:tRNA lysidine(34) synthetase TilS n=1 Tax=Longirhabdus pacifica TaxID=2305227 RepID=UPI00100897D9|nr:tRNA lysidine(34) synthetase TilS [Longirhabdus pacifica]